MKSFVGLIAAIHTLGDLSSGTLEQSKRALQEYKAHIYPYLYLERELANQKTDTILIFTFGSLLDYRSASKTFSNETLQTRSPAVAFGTKRVFNRDVPIKPHHRWGPPIHPDARAMLNLDVTGNDEEVTNGILIEVPIKEISGMRMREEGYDLIPVVVAGWNDYLTESNPETFIAYTFHARDSTRYTSDDIYPRPGYYELARDAAKKQGRLFYEMWLDSTYLADKTTPISVWEEAVKSGRNPTLIKNHIPACQ